TDSGLRGVQERKPRLAWLRGRDRSDAMAGARFPIQRRGERVHRHHGNERKHAERTGEIHPPRITKGDSKAKGFQFPEDPICLRTKPVRIFPAAVSRNSATLTIMKWPMLLSLVCAATLFAADEKPKSADA